MRYINLLTQPLTILDPNSPLIVRSKGRVEAMYLFKDTEKGEKLPIVKTFEACRKGCLPKFETRIAEIENCEGLPLFNSQLVVNWPFAEKIEEGVIYIVAKHMMDRLIIAGYDISNLRYISGPVKNIEGELLGFAGLMQYA